MKTKTTLLLVLVFSIGLFLRLYRIDQNFPQLYADEVAGSYKDWVASIIGQVNFVSQIKIGLTNFIWIFGLTPLGVRLPSAIYGAITIITLYFFSLSVEKHSRQLALITAVLGAIIPWSFMISRIGFAHTPILIILVCLHYIAFMKAQNLKGYVLATIFLILASFFYPSMIIISPVITIFMVDYLLKKLNKKQKIKLFITTLASTLLILVIFFVKYGGFATKSRGMDKFMPYDVNVTADSNLFRGIARFSSPSIFSFELDPEVLGNKILYNLPLSVINVFVRNYLSFFSPDFLFLKGDTTLRHSTGMVGSFYPILLPFMVYGGYLLTKSGDSRVIKTFLVWILVSPIPGAITKDGPGYLLRVITMMPFLTYLSAFGLVSFYRNYLLHLKPRFKFPILAGITLGIAFSAYSFFYGYFHVYPVLAAKNYEYGFKELSDFQVRNNSAPLLVVWDGFYPHFYFRFWQRTTPGEYLSFSQSDLMVGKSTFHQVFPNLYFSWPVTSDDLIEFVRKNTIVYTVFSEEYLKKNPEYKMLEKNIVDIVLYPDQSNAFSIFKTN